MAYKIKHIFTILTFLVFISCSKNEQLQTAVSLPSKLKEVSGITTIKGSNLLWMHNDSGNKNELYGVTTNGKIEKTVTIKAENNDWEDITSDTNGNVYIGDFGNNKNIRKNLVILKVKSNDLLSKKSVEVEKIKFSYPNQYKFPPKKENLFFDAESLFYTNGFLYVFTKSRVKKYYGKTQLYKIPAKKGVYVAELIGEFTNCNQKGCWITSAAISPDKKKVVLLSANEVLMFTNFTSDNFLKGKLTKFDLGFSSQKEGLTFKDNNTLYITDERVKGSGGNLYEFYLK